MAKPFNKRLALLVLVPALIFGGLWIALPFVISSDLVRDALAREIAVWTGHRVQVGSSLQLRLTPSLRARLDDVTVLENGRENRTLLSVDTMEADISFWALFGGNLRFDNFLLVRPRLLVTQDADGRVSWLTGGGRFQEGAESGRRAIAEDPAKPDLSRLTNTEFAAFRIVDGAITLQRRAWAMPESIISIDGRLVWSHLNRPLSFSGEGIWRGEASSLDLSVDAPLLAMAGGATALNFKLASKPLALTFQGQGAISDQPFARGKLTLQTASVRHMLAWTRADIAPGRSIGKLAVNSEINADGDRYRFDNAILTLDDHSGSGAFELSVRPGGGVAISGTLDFDALDLVSFGSSLLPLPASGDELRRPVDLNHIADIELDLRMSAQTASAGPYALSDVAATAQIRSGRAVFDLADSGFGGGGLQARLKLERRDNGIGEISVTAAGTSIDIAAVTAISGLSGVTPVGKTDFSLKAAARLGSWLSAFEEATGTMRLNSSGGAIKGIDLGSYVSRGIVGEFLTIRPSQGMQTAIDRLAIEMTLGNGMVRIMSGEIDTPLGALTLSGYVPYVSRSLALSAHFTPSGKNAGAPGGFFVGGSWSAPILYPIQSPGPQ